MSAELLQKEYWDLTYITGPLVFLRNGGRFFILNNTNRRVPTREAAWVDDGLDIRALLGEFFTLREQGIPADHVTPSNLRNVVFWGCYQKPG